MWRTVFVIDSKEILSDKDFPAFQVGGKLCLRMLDAIDSSQVSVGFVITDVCYDLESNVPKQYIFLKKLNG